MIARLACESRTTQHNATRPAPPRRSVSATFLIELRAAAPRSPMRFQASSMIRQSWRSSRCPTSIDCHGSEGRVGEGRGRIGGPAERYGEGLPEDEPKRDPDLEWQTDPQAALDVADPAL